MGQYVEHLTVAHGLITGGTVGYPPILFPESEAEDAGLAIPGPVGPAGPQGLQGATGPQGPPGTGGGAGTGGLVLFPESEWVEDSPLLLQPAPPPSTQNARLTADQGTALLTATNIPGLSFPVAAGEVWSFEVYARTNKSAGTVGIKYAISFPSGATLEAWISGTTTGATVMTNERVSVSGTLTTAAFNTAANIDGWIAISGVIVNGATAGTLQIQQASVTSGTATARANSYITARKVA